MSSYHHHSKRKNNKNYAASPNHQLKKTRSDNKNDKSNKTGTTTYQSAYCKTDQGVGVTTRSNGPAAAQDVKMSSSRTTAAPVMKPKTEVVHPRLHIPMSESDCLPILHAFTPPFEKQSDRSSDETRELCEAAGTSIAWGELKPEAVESLIVDFKIMSVPNAVFVDLGCGNSKILFQLLLRCPNIVKLYGVELDAARFNNTVAKYRELEKTYAGQFQVQTNFPDEKSNAKYTDKCVLTLIGHNNRTLEIRRGNMFEQPDLYKQADFLLAEVKFIDTTLLPQIVFSAVKINCKLLTYEDVDKFQPYHLDTTNLTFSYGTNREFGTFKMLPKNSYPTTWSPNGYPFDKFVKVHQFPHPEMKKAP